MSFKTFFFLVIVLISSQSYAYQIYDTEQAKYVTIEEFVNIASGSEQFVLGEFHYDDLIQKAEADIIKKIVQAKNIEGEFSLGWEFLNYTDQDKLNSLINSFKNGEIESLEIIKNLFPGQENTKLHRTYLPLFEMIKKLDGDFLATNAPREWKKIIIAKGIEYLDADKVPANMSLGSNDYFSRFKEAMGGHIDDELLKKYYVAQCYTDSVISTSISELSSTQVNFLVIGAFHSDFDDAVVSKLDALTGLKSMTIKFVNAKQVGAQGIKKFLTGSHKYGIYARFVVAVQ